MTSMQKLTAWVARAWPDKTWCAWAVLWGTSALGSGAGSDVGQQGSQTSNESWQAVQRTVKTTCQHDSECRSLGVGYRACGGPQQFIAWSAPHSDEAALMAAAARYERASRKEAQARGEMSTCQVLPDPGALCARPLGAAQASPGRCELRPMSKGSGGAGQR